VPVDVTVDHTTTILARPACLARTVKRDTISQMSETRTGTFALRNKTGSKKIEAIIVVNSKGGKWVQVPECGASKFGFTVDQVVKAFGPPEAFSATERIWVPPIDKVRRLLKVR